MAPDASGLLAAAGLSVLGLARSSDYLKFLYLTRGELVKQTLTQPVDRSVSSWGLQTGP
jgi:hypothetical protein